jgi:aerobic-type carbon monoxide dehydrogenase small subunit (CoxS/CutS family)
LARKTATRRKAAVKTPVKVGPAKSPPENHGNTPAKRENAPCAGIMVALTVNGRAHSMEVQPNWTLWYVLRDKLGITSPKDMCNGYGACGSCTVIVDGRPILSCMTLAADCNGTRIETAEGIADANHPLVEAYTELYAMQCGYCTPGFLVTAKALLDRNPRPTEADIREALGGNLCKCSSYPAHIRAVLVAAQELWEARR